MQQFNHNIFVINLPQRIERRAILTEHLAELDLLRHTHWIEGIQGRIAQGGLAMSVLNALKKAYFDLKLDWALILEDDVEFLYNPSEVITHLGTLPVHFDLCYLGANIYTTPQAYNEHFYELTGAMALHAVIYNRRAMGEIIDRLGNNELHKPLDVYYQEEFIAEGNCYCVSPLCAVQRDGLSDIEGKLIEYTKVGTSKYPGRGWEVMDFSKPNTTGNPHYCWYKSFIK